MPNPVIGQIGSAAHTSNQYVIQMDRRIQELVPSKRPFTYLLTRLRREMVGRSQFEWIERRENQDTDYLSATADASTTTLTFGNYQWARARDRWVVPSTGEQFLVTTTPTTTSVTVTRGAGETSAATIPANSRIVRIGSLFQEGARSRSGMAASGTRQYNYTQIFRSPAEVSRTAQHTKMYTGDAWRDAIKDASFDHAMDMERAFLWGERYSSGTTTLTRGTRGLLPWATGQVLDLSGAAYGGRLTEPIFIRFARMAFRFNGSGRGGADRLVMLCSPTILHAVTNFGRDLVRISPRTKEIGLDIRTYQTPFGAFQLVLHPLFEGETYGQQAIAFPMASVAYKYLEGSDTHVKRSIQETDRDGQKLEFLTEAGLQFVWASTRASVLTGVGY